MSLHDTAEGPLRSLHRPWPQSAPTAGNDRSPRRAEHLTGATYGSVGLGRDAVQAAWRGIGQEPAMVVVLDPYPRWRGKQQGTLPPTPGGCELLAASWTGPVDAPDATRSLLQVLDQVLHASALDPVTLAQSMPESAELITLRASDVLGPWPTAPATSPSAGRNAWGPR